MKFSTLMIAAIAASMAGPVVAQEMREFTDSLDRTVEIPVEPLRIVSLHDANITVPLLELGITPVGSQGRVTAEGAPFIRGSAKFTGIDFENSSIKFVGNHPPDIEAVAALDPDLIIGIVGWENPAIEQLEAIAPTLIFDTGILTGSAIYEVLADVTGMQDQMALLEGRYEAQLAEIRRLVDTQNITVSFIQGVGGELAVWHTYGAIGTMLRETGFNFPSVVDAIPEGQSQRFSGEQITDFDADFIFVTYRTDQLETPADAITALEEVVPNFCDFLHACRENQMIIMPREDASSSSFYARGSSALTIITQLSGRRFVPQGE